MSSERKGSRITVLWVLLPTQVSPTKETNGPGAPMNKFGCLLGENEWMAGSLAWKFLSLAVGPRMRALVGPIGPDGSGLMVGGFAPAHKTGASVRVADYPLDGRIFAPASEAPAEAEAATSAVPGRGILSDFRSSSSIFSRISVFSLRNCFAFSLPCPMRSPL